MFRRSLGIAICGWAFTGCTYAGVQAPGVSRDDLSGVWEICMRVSTAGGTGAGPFTAGYVSLTRASTQQANWFHLGRPDHYGTYTLDLSAVGIARDPRIPLPLIGVTSVGDSLRLVLDPFGSHGSIVINARHTNAGVIEGEWFHQAYAAGASGVTVMVRIPDDELPLPYPVGGEPVVPAIAGCRK